MTWRAALNYQHAMIGADRHMSDAMGTQLALFWYDLSGEDDDGDATGSLEPTA